jgi:two-component SAPR family response regulator
LTSFGKMNWTESAFKVALHGVNKALEPNRKSHGETTYFHRIGQTYQLDTQEVAIDSFVFEEIVALGNQYFVENPAFAIKSYREAIGIYLGSFLPNRIYEDWCSDERERLQLMYLSTIMALAELLVDENPIECIQLCQKAILEDIAWEEAYRIQMRAYLKKGNRPMAIKTYQVCEKVLYDELGIKPLPDTKNLYNSILSVT